MGYKRFDEDGLFYDITKRNSVMSSKAGENDDEEDDDLF